MLAPKDQEGGLQKVNRRGCGSRIAAFSLRLWQAVGWMEPCDEPLL